MIGLKAQLFLALILAVFLAGCLVRGQDVPSPRPSEPPDRPTLVPTDPATGLLLNVYFPRLFEDGSLGLRAAPRTARADAHVERQLLEALLAGPNGDERADSHYPTLDRRTRLLQVDLVGDLASIEFDLELRRVIGRPFSELAYWSIVYTATEVPTVERVTLVQSGGPLLSFGAPPVAISPGASRARAPEWVRPR